MSPSAISPYKKNSGRFCGKERQFAKPKPLCGFGSHKGLKRKYRWNWSGKRGLKNHPKRGHILGPTPCYLVKIDTLYVSRVYFGAVSRTRLRGGGFAPEMRPNSQKKSS
jgi:hypothetical protein